MAGHVLSLVAHVILTHVGQSHVISCLSSKSHAALNVVNSAPSLRYAIRGVVDTEKDKEPNT